MPILVTLCNNLIFHLIITDFWMVVQAPDDAPQNNRDMLKDWVGEGCSCNIPKNYFGRVPQN